MINNLLRKWGIMAKKPKTPNARDPNALQAARDKGDIFRSQYNQQVLGGPKTNIWGTQNTTFNQQTIKNPHTGEDMTINVPTQSFDFNPNAQRFQNQLWDSLNSGSTEDIIMKRGGALLNPLLNKRRAALEANRASQGILAGSDAFSQLEGDIMSGEADAMNKLVLNAWNTGQNERTQAFNMMQGLNNSMNVAPSAVDRAGMIGGSDYLKSSNAAMNDKWKKYKADYADWEKTPDLTDWAYAGIKGGLGMALTGNPYAGALIGLGEGDMFGKDGLFGQSNAPWWSKKK